MTIQGYFHVPGQCSNRNMNTNGSVLPLNNVNNLFKNDHYYNSALLLPSPDQHLVVSKEVVKQTMLKHEAIFKDQICELHRIYWRQRELMDEMKKNESLNHHLPQGTVQSNFLSSQNLCDYAQKTSHVLSLPRENPACYRSSVSVAESDFSLLHINDRKFAHSCPDPTPIDFSLKGCHVSSKKFSKKILDLELPATEYMDSEDEESFQKVPEVPDHSWSRISEAAYKSDFQPYNGSGGFYSVCREYNLEPGSVSSKKNLLADLNEPFKLEEKSVSMSIYLPDLNEPNKNEEEVTAASKILVDLNEPIKLQEEEALSSDFHTPLAGPVEFSSQDLSQKSNSDYQVSPTEITQNTKIGRNGKTSSNDLHLEKYDDEAGQSRRNATSLSPGLSEEVWFQVSPTDVTHNTKIGRISKTSSNDLHPQKYDDEAGQSGRNVAALSPGLNEEVGYQVSPTDVTHNTKIGRNSKTSSNDLHLEKYDDEAGSSKPSSVLSSKKQKRNIVRAPIVIQALPCFSSSIGLRKNSKSSISDPGVAGKRSCHRNSSKFIPTVDICHGKSSCHGPTKLEDSEMGLPWPVRKRKCGKRSESSILEEISQNPSEDEAIKNTANDRVINMNLDCDPVPESEEQVTTNKLVAGDGLVKNISCFGAGIDFNCMADDESSIKPSLPTEAVLEAPVSPENKESSPPRRDSDEKQVETPSELLGKEDGDVQEDLAQNAVEAIVSGEEDRDLQDELFRKAATALVSISSSLVQNCAKPAACELSKPSRSDELQWFANVVSLVADDPDSEFQVVLSSKNDNNFEEHMFNGLDYFESMTLDLIETKVEEVDWFKTNEPKDKKEEANGHGYLPSQQRRGRMRRARLQRKDFQKEILPHLASLTRCEVTEDIQTIEGLIQAASNSQRGTVCTRNKSRNAQARGMKKRSCISSSNLTDVRICSPSKQHSSFKGKDTEERRLIGWGNLTKRRRGPRIHATNPWLR